MIMAATTTSIATAAAPREKKATSATADWRVRYFNWFCTSVLIVFAAVWIIPLLWAIVTSLRPDAEIATNPTSWWSNHWTLHAYQTVIGVGNVGTWYLNSLIVSALSATLAVLVCSMAGFALSQTRFRGRGLVFGLVAAGLFIPSQVLILPLFQEFNSMHLLNTYWGLILPAVPAPIAVLIFSSFFNGIPAELADSAHVDGASWVRIYWKIYMPLCRPAISAVAIFTFVWSWNSFLWPLLVMTNPRTMTIPVGLSQVSSAYGIQYAEIMASAVLGALPLLVVFLLFQRRIVEGVATTGIK
jgi:multiple sugar transport system permease protein